jgi:hypothetical protein
VDDAPRDVLGRLQQSLEPLQDRLEELGDDSDIDRRRQGRDQICDDYYCTHVDHAERYFHETLRGREDRLNAAWISERQAPEAGTTPRSWFVNELAKTWSSQAKELTRAYPVLHLVIDADRRFGEHGFTEAERRTRVRFRELYDGQLREAVPLALLPAETALLPTPPDIATAAENVDSVTVPASQPEMRPQRVRVPRPAKLAPSNDDLVERRRKLHRLKELCRVAKGHRPNQTELAVLLGYNHYSTITKYLKGTGSEECAQRVERVLRMSKDEIKSEIERQAKRVKGLPAKLRSKANSNPPL